MGVEINITVTGVGEFILNFWNEGGKFMANSRKAALSFGIIGRY